MDGVQHDLSQKIDNLQDSISRFANLNTMQEKETLLLNLIKIPRVSMKWRLKRENLQCLRPLFAKIFGSCEAPSWHTSAITQHSDPHFAAGETAAKCQSGVSQLRNHPLAHECHFAAAKWATKIALLREIHPPLRKCSKLQKWATKFPFYCQMISKLPNGCEMISKLKNGCENVSIFSMSCETPLCCENGLLIVK
ncbi:hypothetical protein CK203_066455 [Vitis vinifera]|uniref:Uncharacterized protein n=1 Tax=Vitis vinifera TaxID=29760 RepID=A0A438GTL2_VITVI|nr:hypothetical protein CK203_066455 [Vitis vinifera]